MLKGIFKIPDDKVYHNPTTPFIYEMATRSTPSNPTTNRSMVAKNGSIVAYSGEKMGRVPKDKRIVIDEVTKDKIWWGDVNIPMEKSSYDTLEGVAIDYINNKGKLFVIDGYIGWDPDHNIRCRVLCTRSYHALFMKNMMIQPTKEQLETDFKDGADYYIFNAGEFYAPVSEHLEGVPKTKTCVAVNLQDKKITILGSQYAGEMKKGLFGLMHYLMPQKGVLSMHASANEGKDGDVTLLFGLSGTGKTTLSADPHRALIGDDEHGWTDKGIFNLEGGCYAKAIGLDPEKEPEIFGAIKFGTVLENVKFYEDTRTVNYNDTSLTENTRVCYPLEYIDGVKIPALGGHPKNILFLTCDAFGVLPPVSKLTPEQAMYHFISGYTAKVAGTEDGVKDPSPTFSACFGEAFLPLHPTVYAELLAKKVKEHNTNVWLINTGWSGGKFGQGKRMSLKITRKIIDEIHSGNLSKQETQQTDIFNLQIPNKCEGIDSNILNPRNTWDDKQAFDRQIQSLGKQFNKNFEKYSDNASADIRNAGPKL